MQQGVHHIRKMATRGVLLALAKCDDRGKFQEAIENAVGEMGNMQTIFAKMRVDVLDLDSHKIEGEVLEALKRPRSQL